MTTDTPPVTPPESLALEDFLELVVFDRAVESEGLEYAAENYPPAFADEHLREVEDILDGLQALLRTHAGAIETFWSRLDAGDQYDAALEAHRDRRSERVQAAAKKTTAKKARK